MCAGRAGVGVCLRLAPCWRLEAVDPNHLLRDQRCVPLFSKRAQSPILHTRPVLSRAPQADSLPPSAPTLRELGCSPFLMALWAPLVAASLAVAAATWLGGGGGGAGGPSLSSQTGATRGGTDRYHVALTAGDTFNQAWQTRLSYQLNLQVAGAAAALPLEPLPLLCLHRQDSLCLGCVYHPAIPPC